MEDTAPPPPGQLGTMSMPPDSPQILAVCSSLAGIKPYTLALGCTCRLLAPNGGDGSYTLALGSRRQGSSCMLMFSSKRRRRVVYAGVELKTGVLSHTRAWWVVLESRRWGYRRLFAFVFVSVGRQCS